MMRHHLHLGLTVLMLAGAPAVLAAPNDPCVASSETEGVVATLPAVAPLLASGRTLRVLAVGSATMFGPEASLAPGTVTSQSLSDQRPAGPPVPQTFTQEASERAFPRQMAKVLKATVPGLAVEVTVRGGRGLLANSMLQLLKTELAAQKYDLVLWQTGTVEAVRNLPPGEFGQVLADGAEAVQAAGANLVLIDPQYSRFLQTNTNLEPYVQALSQVAAMPGVILFRRYDLMRSWVNDGQIDLERTARADRQRVVETLHSCLGKHLARFVLESARS